MTKTPKSKNPNPKAPKASAQRRPTDSRKPPQDRQRPPAHGTPTRGARKGWDAVAAWYDGWMGKGGSRHHQQLAIPSVIDLLALQRGESVLDIGAGQGVLASHILKTGASYTGVDVSPRLLEIARQNNSKAARFYAADACALSQSAHLKPASFDAVVFLLSLQDINPLSDALASASWALKPGGRAVLLMTHPAFRIPRQSGWGYDENRKLTFRRVDRYLTPLNVPMKPYPGASGVTISFHRPLSDYVNGLAEAGLLLNRMEEITSYKAEDNPAEAEIPLFVGLRAVKVG